MADQKISELTALTGANLANDDEFVVVDTSATVTKKITKSELFDKFLDDTGLDTSGAAPLYACRAWVNFGYVASAITVRASGNVASVTRITTGTYRITFSTAMVDDNFAAIVSPIGSPDVYAVQDGSFASLGAVQIQTKDISTNNLTDVNRVNVAIFR